MFDIDEEIDDCSNYSLHVDSVKGIVDSSLTFMEISIAHD